MKTDLADRSSANMQTPRAYAFAGTTMTVLVSGEETGGAFTVLHVIKPPGSSIGIAVPG